MFGHSISISHMYHHSEIAVLRWLLLAVARVNSDDNSQPIVLALNLDVGMTQYGIDPVADLHRSIQLESRFAIIPAVPRCRCNHHVVCEINS